jgi:cytidylate kinase
MMKYAASLDAVRSAVRAMAASHRGEPPAARGAALQPVVTISRQAGVTASAVSRRLVDILNHRHPGPTPWMEFDRQLVERIAADHNLSEDLVARFDERDRSWFEHFTAGITGSATGTDIAMKSAKTIRALAKVGRAVIIGRAGQSILAGMKHVVHVRLVAPLEWRAAQYPRDVDAAPDANEQTLRRIDIERARYVKQHFNRDVNDPLLYDLIINMARVGTDRAAHTIAQSVEGLDLR